MLIKLLILRRNSTLNRNKVNLEKLIRIIAVAELERIIKSNLSLIVVIFNYQSTCQQVICMRIS